MLRGRPISFGLSRRDRLVHCTSLQASGQCHSESDFVRSEGLCASGHGMNSNTPMKDFIQEWGNRSKPLVNSVVTLGVRGLSGAAHRLDRLFRASEVPAPASATGHPDRPDPGTKATAHYAIGDLHGMRSLLDEMLKLIAADAQTPDERSILVFLGDFVNRGPHSRQVIERLLEGPSRAGEQWIALRGNHDQLLIDALLGKSETAFRQLMRKGGASTLASYGVAKKDASLARARRAVPLEHLQFLERLPLFHTAGGHVFVHAGIDPLLPLEQQNETAMMNIREPFLRNAHRLPFTVVHGHVPSSRGPIVAPGRVGVDTGAYATGVLTSAVLRDGMPMRFLSTTCERRADSIVKKKPALLREGV